MRELKDDYSSVETYYKSSEVKVIQWTGDNAEKIRDFVAPYVFKWEIYGSEKSNFTGYLASPGICIGHVELHIVRLGDFIIFGLESKNRFMVASEMDFKKNILKLLKDRD